MENKIDKEELNDAQKCAEEVNKVLNKYNCFLSPTTTFAGDGKGGTRVVSIVNIVKKESNLIKPQ